MVPVRVIPAQGATVVGPCVLRLTRKQWARRVSILGPVPKSMKPAKLDGGQSLSFKQGEEFQVDVFEGRLNKALFEDLTPADEDAENGESVADQTSEDAVE